MYLLQNTVANLVSTAGNHQLLNVHILPGKGIEFVAIPAFSSDGELSFPEAVPPFCMLISNAFHAEDQDRLQCDF